MEIAELSGSLLDGNQQIDAQSLDGIRVDGLCRFVLETNPGWFVGRIIAAWSVLEGLPVPVRTASGAVAA